MAAVVFSLTTRQVKALLAVGRGRQVEYRDYHTGRVLCARGLLIRDGDDYSRQYKLTEAGKGAVTLISALGLDKAVKR